MVHYTPEKTAAYERAVRQACMEAMEAAGITVAVDGAVAVRLNVCFEVPESWSKAKRSKAEAGEMLHTTKPDIDNIVKAVFDGCNGVIWKDDSQVCDLRACKGYSVVTGVHVVVEWM
jgi:Holliday junction resolvase RusA-like endonuclease